jgi:hypothetical protein
MAEGDYIELMPPKNRFATIAEMPPHFLWLDPLTIGASPDETEAFLSGAGIPPDRLAELKAATRLAFKYMLDIVPAGRG